MDTGLHICETAEDNAFLAKRAASKINRLRSSFRRTVYIIDSIKRPEEVDELKNIYGRGFYLFAVHSSDESKHNYLKTYCNIQCKEKRNALIDRDQNGKGGHDQNTSKAFHLADFFITENGNNNKVANAIDRFLKIIFGDPFQTPTFHEYAMFMAYAASTKTADMSRQVGAVISKGTDLIATGANECPKPGGGSYWPLFDDNSNEIYDIKGGRDYTTGSDFNAEEKHKLIAKLKDGLSEGAIKILTKNITESGIEDLTEFGRVVHAEMDALLSCARRGISCEGAKLFTTTFPCHNCAKHIISAGIKTLIYVEPYPKSKALIMHNDALTTDECDPNNKTLLLPFLGVGPRQYLNFFSLTLSTGQKIKRKANDSCKKAEWTKPDALPRVKMYEVTYKSNEVEVEKETDAIIAVKLKNTPPSIN